MKINKKYILATIIMISAVIFTIWQNQTVAQYGNKTVQISINTDKQNYALGEVIGLNFEISNLSDENIEINTPNVRTGNLKIYLSSDSVNFREYSGPRWGKVRSRQKIKLKTGESFQTKATILHNKTLETEHLTEYYAEQIRKETIDTNFAFLQSGRYFIKGVYTSNKIKLESETFPIEITEPLGLDIAVWQKLKNNGEYAYFLQTGEIKYQPGTIEREQFIAGLRQISEEFPGSTLAEKINANLVKFDQTQDYLQNLKNEKANE